MTVTTAPTLVTPSATEPASAPAERRGSFYLRLWKRVPRELGYLVPVPIIAIVVSQLLILGISAASALIFVLVGLLIIPLVLLGARYAGQFEVIRLRAAAMPALEEPDWKPPFRGKTFSRAMIDQVSNPHHWLAYLHGAVVSPIVATVTGVIWFTWLVTAITLVTAPFTLTLRPFSEGTGFVAEGSPGVQLGGWNVAEAIAYGLWRTEDPARGVWLIIGSVAAGLLLIALFPFVTRGLTWAHWGPARLMLTRFPSERMGDEVAALNSSRRAAVVAEDQALRRLERDIHDGPQQRLLRLQLDLASAERRLGDDPAAAAELLVSARLLARDTLDELRALTQGFAPPILQDRGLTAALESLGSRSTVPVETTVRLEGVTVPSEVERGAYFIAAELVSNAVKHSHARHIALSATVETLPRPAIAGGEEGWTRRLSIVVEDDGLGGARVVAGHGLAGLSERVLGMRGTFSIGSPADGPTRIEASIPLDDHPAVAVRSADAD